MKSRDKPQRLLIQSSEFLELLVSGTEFKKSKYLNKFEISMLICSKINLIKLSLLLLSQD